jgi:putative MFS transporter
VDDAIERLGYGRFQVRVMIAAGLCFAADAMEVLLLSFLSVVLQSEWALTPEQTAFLTSTVFLGALLGTLLVGTLGRSSGSAAHVHSVSLFDILLWYCDILLQ